MNSVKNKIASTQDLPRVKPYCWLASLMRLLKKVSTLLYKYLSTIFENKGRTDILLKLFISLLSLLLNIETTQASLKSSGNSPCANELLLNSARG